jgi:hypothetical protein
MPSVTAIRIHAMYFPCVRVGASIIGADAMNKEISSQSETDEEIPSFDVRDEMLERAANAEQTALTLIYCTNQWYGCDWPQ